MNDDDDDDDDDDLSRGAYLGGGGAYKRKFTIYRLQRLAVFTAKRTKVSFYG